ncbi:MAG: hypothetical protein LBD06_04435 [Candidatus Accumulibacter sp.]|jgi:hypothetical protein|nr:hypothetical protein [Accumulibacter sp.]
MAISGISSGIGFSPYPHGVLEAAEPSRRAVSGEADGKTVSENAPRSRNGERLSETEQSELAELKKTDRKVRQHEQAHVAAGGGLVVSGPSYQYATGPDGQRYAVAGEVGIQTSPGRTPEETMRRASRIRAAALAPADPSPQDRNVAAQAARMEAQAAQEIAQQQWSETGGPEEGGSEDGAATQAPTSSGADREKTVSADGASAQDGFAVTGAARVDAYRRMAESAVTRPSSGFSVSI